MTIDDKIKNEKLKYDINREAAKISALSSGKIDKYQYLTGEEILRSNQQQIVELANFTYSPLGKAFEKQTKTIEDQGKKQVDALAALKTKEIKPKEIKSNDKFSNYFLNELTKIREYYKPIRFNDITYYFKDSRITPVNFIEFKGPMNVFDSIHKGDKTLEDIENEQEKFKEKLDYIRQGNPKNRSQEQQNTIFEIENLYKSRQDVIEMFNNYARKISGSIYESKQQKGTGLKILTPNQMLQRLPIALAQIKADNNSESLLNEIGQIYSGLLFVSIKRNY